MVDSLKGTEPLASDDLSGEQELAAVLAEAHKAYESDDSQTVTQLCKQALELDPNNADAWGLFARFGGWDSKLYGFDIDFAIDSAKHVLGLVPEVQRYDEAAEIYAARKKQIALILESEMMMPSYTAAKQLHGTMQEWLRLLQEIPYLNEQLLQGEVILVENLCARSRIGIMPADRLVYTAYSSLNGKKTYGETFRQALEERLSAEQGKRDAALESARAQAQEACNKAHDDLAANAPADVLEADCAALQGQLEALRGLTNRAMYLQQVEGLEQQLAKLPPYKFFKVHEVNTSLAGLRKKIAEIDAQLGPDADPIEDALKALRARLDG